MENRQSKEERARERRIEERRRRLEERFEEERQRMEEEIQRAKKEKQRLKERLEEERQRFEERLKEQAEEQRRRYKERLEEQRRRLEEQRRRLKEEEQRAEERLEEEKRRAEERMEEERRQLEEKLKEEKRRAKERLEEEERRFKERLEEQAEEEKRRLEEEKQRFKEKLEEKIRRAKEQAEEEKQRAKEQAEKEQQRAKERLEEERRLKEEKRRAKTKEITRELMKAEITREEAVHLHVHEKPIHTREEVHIREVHKEKRTDAYKKALAEGAADVAYSRVLFLGTAGVGMTSFQNSLMKLPWEPNTISNAVSITGKVRSFKCEWHTLKKDQLSVVSYDDEIEELVGLILAVYKKELEGSDATAYATQSLYAPGDKSFQSLDLPKIICEVEDIISNVLDCITYFTEQPKKQQPFFHFWDCGGQLPFLEILPVFLTSRTLFFLIFDAEKGLESNWKPAINIEGERIDQEEVPMTTLDYMLNWMANIHGHLMTYNYKGGFCEFPRMYCIGTHGDRVKDRKLEIKKELECHYQGKDFRALIEGTVIVDNTTSGQSQDEDPSLQALREAVVRFTEKKLVLKTPLSWILFRKVIQVLSMKYKYDVISLKDAHIIGAASKIPPEDVPHALMFYHELGVLLFYPQIDGMKDKVVLNPKYIVDALGEMFLENFDGGRFCKEWKLFHEFGILVQPLYVELWKEYEDIPSNNIIEVLIHFRIAVEVNTDKYPPPSKQYFTPFILKSAQVNRSTMTIPSDSIQAAPLHITFNSGYVPPGFFTRFVVVLANANEMELCFEKGVCRNRVTFCYQDPNSNSIEHVIITDCHDIIQINVHHHPSDQDLVSFTKICQGIRVLLEKVAVEVEEILKKCASGCIVDNNSTRYIFTKTLKFICISCPTATLPESPHYIKLPPTSSTQSSLVCCEKRAKYRALNEKEKVWFKDVSQSKLRKNDRDITCSDVELLEIIDLSDVFEELQSMEYSEWKTLGLSLGLYHNTLGEIEADYSGSVRQCLLECMAAWLKGKDRVREKGGPSWLSLATALEKIRAIDIARNIRAKYLKP